MPFPTSEADRLRFKLQEYAKAIPKEREVVRNKLVTLPGVNALSMATRYIEGGRERFVELVQMAVLNGIPAAESWWEVYSKLLTNERLKVSFDDVCAASGTSPKDLMAAVVSTAMEYGQDVGNLVAAATHPAVVARLAESAQRITGKYAEVSHKDRIAFLQGQPVRFLPQPRGNTVTVNASANSQAAALAANEPSVPTFADDMSSLSRPRPELPAPSNTPSFLVGAVVEDEE